MRQAIVGCILLVGLLAAPSLWAQSTISDRPWELYSTKGAWGALLPAYELGTNASGATAFRDNLDDVGYLGEWKLVRRFLGTRTSFETRGFYAFAESIEKTDVTDINVPNPSSGASVLGFGNRTHLRSKIAHYGIDVAMRDTWRTHLGGLSAGAGFSYMAFDQKFDVDYGAAQLMREKLDTDFTGGKIFVGWDGCFCDRPTNLDFSLGYYNMESNYRFLEQLIPGSLENRLSKSATTFETTFTTRKEIHGYQLGLTLGAMYISDMPTIQHNVSAPATLDTDDAVTFTVLIEMLM